MSTKPVLENRVPDDPSAFSRWAGRGLGLLTVLFFLALATANLLFPDMLVEANRESGFPADRNMVVGIAALVAAILHALPRTAPLGAILMTGFLGGAIAVNVAAGAPLLSPPLLLCATIGVAAWGGLYLRDPRMRALNPIWQ